MKIKDYKTIMIRSMAITFIIISAIFISLYFMGIAYENTEKLAFDNKVYAFKFVENKGFIFFGKYIYFPIIRIFEKINLLSIKYSSGIIKLLKTARLGSQELTFNVVTYILSSLR